MRGDALRTYENLNGPTQENFVENLAVFRKNYVKPQQMATAKHNVLFRWFSTAIRLIQQNFISCTNLAKSSKKILLVWISEDNANLVSLENNFACRNSSCKILPGNTVFARIFWGIHFSAKYLFLQKTCTKHIFSQLLRRSNVASVYGISIATAKSIEGNFFHKFEESHFCLECRQLFDAFSWFLGIAWNWMLIDFSLFLRTRAVDGRLNKAQRQWSTSCFYFLWLLIYCFLEPLLVIYSLDYVC